MYTKEQIKKGLELAKTWYEGAELSNIEPEQLLECIEKADIVEATNDRG